MIKKLTGKALIHTILIITSLLSIFPFIWLTSTSLKGLNEDIFAYPPHLIPSDFTWANYIDVWGKVNFMGYFWNSVIVAALTVILNLVLSSLAAYPLARMNFKGKKIDIEEFYKGNIKILNNIDETIFENLFNDIK